MGKNLINYVVYPIIVLVVGYFITNNFMTEKSNVVYTLSENIPLTSNNDTQETVQQLEVKNIGNAPAKGLKIQVNKHLSGYRVIPNSQEDKHKVYEDKGFELAYPELSVDGSLKLVIQSTGITKADLSVKYEKGNVKNALSKDTSYTSLVSFGILLIYIGFMLLAFRNIWLDKLGSDATFKSIDLLKRKRPFYAKQEKWIKIRKEAIQRLILKDRYSYSISSSNMNDLFAYRLLDNKIDFLDENEHREYKSEAINALEEKINDKINRYFSHQDLNKLLELMETQKPEDFPNGEWDSYKKKISKKYMLLKKEKNFYRLEDIVIELQTDKPDLIFTEDWDGYITMMRAKYFYMFVDKMTMSTEVVDFYNSCQFYLLEDTSRDRIKRVATDLEVQRLTDFSDANILKEVIELESHPLIKEYTLKRIQQKAVHYRDAQKLYDENQQKNELLNQTENEYVQKQQELDGIMKVVKRQLEIINELLRDPKSIDRIEEYDNPFAKGNFENLQKVADMLSVQESSQV
ncbi:hypothetical protein [Bacillus nitratireducens]|uniref:hypothetical protein n=1 Tax=Bacillus nitratireducens TaxID=2026193 RepID=UPI002E7AA163|nr:hypothetical protein [Bacillus nitratireducens]